MTKLSVKKVKNAIPGSLGVYANIARSCKVTRGAITIFLSNHPEVKQLIEEEREKVADDAENRLYELMSGDAEELGGSTVLNATKMILNKTGRYTEKSEVKTEHSGEVKLQNETIVNNLAKKIRG